MNQRYQDYISGNSSFNSALTNDLNDGDEYLGNEAFGAYGFGEGQNLYDVDLSKFLTPSQNTSIDKFASDQDYAKSLALSQLAGEDPTTLTADGRKNAGKGANMGRYTVDKNALNRDLERRQFDYNNAMKEVSALEQEAKEYETAALNAPVDAGYYDLMGQKQTEAKRLKEYYDNLFKANRKAARMPVRGDIPTTQNDLRPPAGTGGRY